MAPHTPLPQIGDWIRRLGGDQRGSVAAELVLTIPLLLLLILLLAQFAIWAHATHIAHAAASQALAATRTQGASHAEGTTTAHTVLAQLGTGPLRTPRVAVNQSSEHATVDITGVATSVVPFLQLPVNARSVGPIERFVTPEAP